MLVMRLNTLLPTFILKIYCVNPSRSLHELINVLSTTNLKVKHPNELQNQNQISCKLSKAKVSSNEHGIGNNEQSFNSPKVYFH